MTLKKMYAICTHPIFLPAAVQARKAGLEFLQQLHGYFSHDAEDCLMTRSNHWTKRGNS
jgi:hypothetical protein